MSSSVTFLSAAAVLAAGVNGFLPVYNPSTSAGRVCRPTFSALESKTARSASLVMDVEGDSIDRKSKEAITNSLFGVTPKTESGFGFSHFPAETPSSPRSQHERYRSIDKAEANRGMPWIESIDTKSPLLYMNHWEWQLDFMKNTLTNLQLVETEEKFSYQENLKKKARIVNLCFRSDEYRKIRMTYYDAGESCQVFNSVFYPDARYNLPVLGIDVLAFNRKRHLAIVDFQPLHDEEEKHALTYEKRLLAPIKKDYPSINGKMSAKFYDETQFFSQHMLFARFEDETVVEKEVFPAFQRYVKAHVDIVRECEELADDSIKGRLAVLDRQAAYDTYSAERDPAAGLFAAMFGKEWADTFMHEFLFSMSDRQEDRREVVEDQMKEPEGRLEGEQRSEPCMQNQ